MNKIQTGITAWQAFFGRHVQKNPKFWTTLGSFESRILEPSLNETKITQPIFVCGLARSGTTLLLNILSKHSDTAYLQYRDFPFIDIPWFYNKFLTVQKDSSPCERAHQDGILVSTKSPEALDETLWMRYFAHLHDPNSSHELTALPSSFSNYFSLWVKKVLCTKKANRYLSKGNYLVTRLKALITLFPDMKCVIPFRDPISHISSLIKQDRLFTQLQSRDPQVLLHMQQVGHFEFGLDKRAINTGTIADSKRIQALFSCSDNLRAYALQWKVLYDYVLSLLNDSKVSNAIHLVSYKSLCDRPTETLYDLFKFVNLSPDSSKIVHESEKISSPHHPDLLSTYEQADVLKIVGDTYEQLSRYGSSSELD